MSDLNDFRRWLVNFKNSKYGNDNKIHVIEGDMGGTDPVGVLRIKLYTMFNVYTIIAVCKEDGHNYLGCVVGNRRSNPGEEWTRGCDLPDGSISTETWMNIIYSIMNYELELLSPSIINRNECVYIEDKVQ